MSSSLNSWLWEQQNLAGQKRNQLMTEVKLRQPPWYAWTHLFTRSSASANSSGGVSPSPQPLLGLGSSKLFGQGQQAN